MEPHTNVLRPASQAKKAVWVDRVRSAFYEDEACSLPNVTFMAQLPTGANRVQAPAAPVRINQYSPLPPHSRQTQQQQSSRSIQSTSRDNGQSQQQQAAALAAAISAAVSASRPRSQSSAARGPQSLTRRPQQAGAAHRPPAANAAVARAQQRRPTTVTCSQNPHGSITVHARYPYIDWNSPLFQVPPQPYAAQMSASASMPPAPLSSSATYTSINTSSAGPPANKKIKQEPGITHQTVDESYWEARPKNPHESSMVSQLRQMGFADVREMLAGIRHVSANDMNSQVESAMMWIVSQREEAEEARKLDAARARSEMLRAEQARLRKQAAHERLWGTSMEDWLSQSDLFRGSVVLKEARECLETLIFDNTIYKEKLIRFLELEKKARKWYGTSVPWCFLCNISERWKSLSVDGLVKSIESETNALESAMYSLSNQQGGVPKLFLEARENAEKNGRPVSPGKEATSADDSDDEVIVVKEVSASEADVRMNSVSSNGMNCEVIELL